MPRIETQVIDLTDKPISLVSVYHNLAGEVSLLVHFPETDITILVSLVKNELSKSLHRQLHLL